MESRRPNKTIAFLLSVVPGLGHLYLGAMNRGLQLMIIFFGSIFLMDLLRLGVFPFWLPIIWFYCLFDALQKADDYVLYGKVIDEPIVEWQVLKAKNTWFGWGLIFLGGYLLLERLLGRYIAAYLTISWHDFRSFIVASLLIAIGAFLLWGKRVKNDA
jgi:hypothetical protein